jgi:hypothetical protein
MQGRSLDPKPYKIAILWRRDADARQAATPQNNRFYRIFEELAAVGIYAEPAVYDASPISPGAGASSISRFSRACPTA